MLDGKGKPRPVMNVLTTLQNSAARLCDQLGLSPTSRARLGVDLAKGADLAAELAKAQAAGDRARQRIADSEVPR
jgi:phage terminase small subunit